MKSIAMLNKFWRDEDGGESVEWPLFVALIVVGLIVTLVAMKDSVIDVLERITTELTDAAAAT